MSRKKQHTDLEVVQKGFANGVSPNFPLNDKQKEKMIQKATKAYARFLEALDCDWQNDPNSSDTPHRVAKAYVNDLWAGRYTQMSPITSFPSDGYDGIVIERNIVIEILIKFKWFFLKELIIEFVFLHIKFFIFLFYATWQR